MRPMHCKMPNAFRNALNWGPFGAYSEGGPDGISFVIPLYVFTSGDIPKENLLLLYAPMLIRIMDPMIIRVRVINI